MEVANVNEKIYCILLLLEMVHTRASQKVLRNLTRTHKIVQLKLSFLYNFKNNVTRVLLMIFKFTASNSRLNLAADFRSHLCGLATCTLDTWQHLNLWEGATNVECSHGGTRGSTSARPLHSDCLTLQGKWSRSEPPATEKAQEPWNPETL